MPLNGWRNVYYITLGQSRNETAAQHFPNVIGPTSYLTLSANACTVITRDGWRWSSVGDGWSRVVERLATGWGSVVNNVIHTIGQRKAIFIFNDRQIKDSNK